MQNRMGTLLQTPAYTTDFSFFLQSQYFDIKYMTVAPMAQLDRASDYGSEG